MKAAGGWVPCDKAGEKGAWWADDRQEELEGAILERNALVSLFVFCCVWFLYLYFAVVVW